MATVPPFLKTILEEADEIAPNRSHASDGTIGDAAHLSRLSDHNPDARGIVHAADVTHDPAGGFDACHWGEVVRARCEAGTEIRISYLVSHDFGRGCDIIASPQRLYGIVGPRWRWRKKSSNDHANHLHISILALRWVEQSTAYLFRRAPTIPLATWRDDLPKPTDVTAVLHAGSGGVWKLTADGGVRAESGAPFHGSYPGLPAADRQGDRYFIDITKRLDGKTGYTLWANDGGAYTFGP